MNAEIKLLLVYIIIINLLSVIICIADKFFAKKNLRRVSEKKLVTLCILGGSIGMYITMRIIRHKTRHNKFMLGIPLIFILQMILFILIWLKVG